MHKLRCCICEVLHKTRSDKFPEARIEKRWDEETQKFTNHLIGYVCRKCIRKRINRGVKKSDIK